MTKLREIDTCIIVYADLNVSLSLANRRSKKKKKKISKNIKDLKETMNKLDQMEIYRTMHLTVTKYKFKYRWSTNLNYHMLVNKDSR